MAQLNKHKLKQLNGVNAVNVLLRKRVLLLMLAAVLTIIIIPKGGFVPNYYQPEDIASRDIKAPRGFLVPEPELTEQKRQTAEKAVLPVYDYDTRPSQAVAHKLTQALALLRDIDLSSAGSDNPVEDVQSADVVNEQAEIVVTDEPAELVTADIAGRYDEVAQILGIDITADQVAALHRLATIDLFVKQFSQSISASLNHKIVGNIALFKSNWHGAITVRDLETKQDISVSSVDDVFGLQEVVSAVSRSLFGDQELTPDALVLLTVVQKMIRPNLTFSQSETELRRRAASEAVLPVLLQVKRGEMIVREGARLSEEQVRKLTALQSAADGGKLLRCAFGLFLIIVLTFYIIHRFAKMNIRKYDPQFNDLLFLAVTFITFFVVSKVGIFISTAMQSAFPYIDSACYYYALPFAAGAMLVRIVLNSEVAYVFALLFAILVGMLFGNNLLITVYALVGGITASHWVRHSKARSNLYRAGLYLSLANMVAVLAIFSISSNPFDIQLLYRLGFAFVSGLGCAVIVNGTIPMVESIFKYTTDFKLLELANMNTPILRELMIQAPGTYHHSIVVGNLVENAAESIGANPLLARVAAYYHDIGKIKKPLYFAENMRLPENRHDKLAPSMSALILISHVKDGVELAREQKLGQNLIDIIHQHHGTALIKFFYDKAQQRDKDAQVKEQDYRYPGPKPQTREAALVMLADAVEAASRTLSEPTPARIQGMVQKLINKIFIDGQLDECELTLKDLHEIARSFNRILSGIFHNRIDYPEPAYKERDKDSQRDSPRDGKKETQRDGKKETQRDGKKETQRDGQKDRHRDSKRENKTEQKNDKSDTVTEKNAKIKRNNGDDIHRESTKDTRDPDERSAESGSEDLKRLGMS